MAYEILVANLAIGNVIRDAKSFQIPSMMQIGTKEGMILMDQSLAKLVKDKVISYEHGYARAENKKLIMKPV